MFTDCRLFIGYRHVVIMRGRGMGDLKLRRIQRELEAQIAALPEYQEVDGVIYRKSPLTGFYYLIEPERIPFFTREEAIAHAKTCPNEKCPFKKKYLK